MEVSVAERSYSYPAKNAGRQVWMRFLPPVFTHPRDFMLYLPARENLELERYLAKGLSPSQLIGAEHDRAEYPFVVLNAKGIQVVPGNVADAVEFVESHNLPRLRGANLDFDGRSHTFTEELLALARVMPSSRGSFLSITSHAARDMNALVQGTVNAAKIFTTLGAEPMFVERYGRMLAMYRNLLKLIPTHKSSDMAHFQREMGILWWIALMFGVIDRPEEATGYYTLNKPFIRSSDRILSELTEEVCERVSDRSSESDIVLIKDDKLLELVSERHVCAWVTAMQRVAYWSSNRQPMRTWHFAIQPIPKDSEPVTMQELVAQVWSLACNAPIVYIDKDGMQVQIG
jgi:hypothetical protein